MIIDNTSSIYFGPFLQLIDNIFSITAGEGVEAVLTNPLSPGVRKHFENSLLQSVLYSYLDDIFLVTR